MHHWLLVLLIAFFELAGCRPAHRHPDPIVAVRDCEAALATLADAEPPRGVLLAIDTCKELFVEPSCREAWGALPMVDPARRHAEAVPRLVALCRDAYCDGLPDPTPTLCRRPDAGDPNRADAFAMRADLFAAALRRDLGAEARGNLPTRLAMLLDFLRPIPLSVPVPVLLPTAPAERPPEPVIALRSAGGGVIVTLRGAGEGEWRLPASPAAADYEPLLAALRAREPRSRRASIAAERSLPYAAIVSLMDALRTGGVDELVFMVESAGDAP